MLFQTLTRGTRNSGGTGQLRVSRTSNCKCFDFEMKRINKILDCPQNPWGNWGTLLSKETGTKESEPSEPSRNTRYWGGHPWLSLAAGCHSWIQCLCCPWSVGVVGGTSVTAKMKSPCSSPSEVLGGVCLPGRSQLSCEWNRAMFRYSGDSQRRQTLQAMGSYTPLSVPT